MRTAPSSSGRVAAVVLAAGGGTRFSGDAHKLRTVVRGKPVVTWAVESAVAAQLDGALVVTGAVDLDDLLPTGSAVAVVRNERWADGQATSLHCAIAWADERGYDAVVVGLADQPFVPADAWRAVAAVDDSPIAVATYGGRRRNPVKLHRDVWPLLPASGDEGARRVIAGNPDLVREVACDGDPADVDTVEDLEAWS
jgi:CTP:molybdopterin cytidylyltransferase MocA